MTITRSSIFFTLCLFIGNPISSISQTIDWLYEVKAKETTVPQFFWVDQEGNGYYNIRQQNPDKPGDANYGSFLIMLDAHGQYKRTTKINNCNRSIKLLPFAKNKLIASGHTCAKDFVTKDTRLFNYKGKTLKIKKNAFPGSYFASIPTNEGFTFFSKPTRGWGYTYISIGKIDKKLNISYEKVPLESIAKEDLGIVSSYRDPALFTNGTWAVPFQYGRIHTGGKGISQDHGTVLGVKDSEIIWQYPEKLLKRKVESICSYQKNIAVLMSRYNGNHLFVVLDENGKVLEQIKVNAERQIIRGLSVTKKYIIVLGLNKIFWFNKSGELKKELNLSELGITHANRMQLLEDNSLICSAVKNGNAVIFKINFGRKRPKEIVEKQQEEIKKPSRKFHIVQLIIV